MSRKWTKLIDQFVDEKTHNSRRPWGRKTIAWYRNRLGCLARYGKGQKLKPKKMKSSHLHRFFSDLERQGSKYTTRKGTFTAVRHFFRWLYQAGHIKVDPFAADPTLLPPKRVRIVRPVLPLAYARQMIAAAEAEDTVIAIRDAAIMRLLLTTGMRREEVTTLTIGQIDLQRREIIVKGKFDHQRRSFLRETTAWAIDRWLAVRPRTFDRALFISLDGRHRELKPNALNRILPKWRDVAGLPEVSVSPHRWRRLFASQLAEGQNPFALQNLLGHEDIATSAAYVRSSPQVQRELLLSYGPDAPLPGEVSPEQITAGRAAQDL